eukprot:5777083-Amphidinium_carterae.1
MITTIITTVISTGCGITVSIAEVGFAVSSLIEKVRHRTRSLACFLKPFFTQASKSKDVALKLPMHKLTSLAPTVTHTHTI